MNRLSVTKITKHCVLLITLTIAISANAQLYVGPGSTLYVPAGSTLQVDSLMLVPSATLALANNKIEKSYMPEWAPGTGHTTINQVYTVDTPFNFEGTAAIIYADAGLNGNTAAALNLLRAQEITDSLGFAPASSVNMTTHMVSAVFTTPQRIGKFSAGNGATPLPVTLLSFDAWREGARVRLLWKAASEKDCAAYLIERSADGMHFNPLLRAPAAGNAPDELSYLRYDELPLFPNNYYRLAALDRDGRLSYFGVRKVTFTGDGAGLQISAWPIPAEDDLNISFSETPAAGSVVTLADMAGRVLRQIAADDQRISLSLSDLSAGIYLLRYTAGDQMLSLRIERR